MRLASVGVVVGALSRPLQPSRTPAASGERYSIWLPGCGMNRLLRIACRHGSSACVAELLAAGADVCATDNVGRTPLEIAAINAHAEVRVRAVDYERATENTAEADGCASECQSPTAQNFLCAYDTLASSSSRWAGHSRTAVILFSALQTLTLFQVRAGNADTHPGWQHGG